MRVDIEYVMLIKKLRRDINLLDFNDIQWYKDGEEVIVEEKDKKEWKFTGLCNTDFVSDDGTIIKFMEG